MQLYLENETDITFNFDTEQIAETVINKVLEVEECPFETEVNLLITDNEGIREYNSSMRGIDKPTDVLSFPGLFLKNRLNFIFRRKRWQTIPIRRAG